MQNIKKLMQEKGYNYSHLSKMLNCSKAYIWQIINFKRKLSYEQAILIASIFNMKPDKLFYDDFIDDNLTLKIKEISKIKKGLKNHK